MLGIDVKTNRLALSSVRQVDAAAGFEGLLTLLKLPRLMISVTCVRPLIHRVRVISAVAGLTTRSHVFIYC